MTDEKQTVPTLYNVSRRRVLGGLGAIGLASAGAGLGTSAFFSDEENFEGNVLTAGALDLTVDWEEHYHLTNEQVQVPTGDNGATIDGVLMSDPQDDNYVGFPDPQNPMVWVHVDAIDDYMDLTSIEAYPDADDDGIQDDLTEYSACDDFAQTPEDLHPTMGTGLRTLNEDTAIYDDDEVVGYKPLVSLEDVKPGDFGELTLSFHLCDNPGYVWFNGQLVNASENGLTEPEEKDPDEVEGVVELLDSIETMVWYDEDGDNVFEPSGVSGKVDVVLVLDESGSMQGTKMTQMKAGAKGLIDALTLGQDAAQVGVVSFQDGGNDPTTLRQGLTTDAAAAKAGVDAIPNDNSGRTNMEAGVEAGHEELLGDDTIIGSFTPSGNDRDDAAKIMVFLGDGAPNEGTGTDGDVDPAQEAQTAKDAGIEIYTIGYGITAGSQAATVLEAMASEPKDEHFYIAVIDEIEQVFAQISQVITGEEAFFRGTLRDLLATLEDGLGIPLDGNRVTPFDELGDPATAEAREPFVNSTTNALGLAWWLPLDHANEIQTDSVEFDLGFYTEQARHNDGSGMMSTPS